MRNRSETITMIAGALALVLAGCGAGSSSNVENLSKGDSAIHAKAVAGEKLADEGGSFTVENGTTVRYGAGTSFIEKVVSGDVRCDNDTFTDPIYGTVKACFFVSVAGGTTVRKVATEGESFTLNAPTTIRYGINGVYVEQILNGVVSCTNDVFGDPVFGTLKECLAVESAANPIDPSPLQATSIMNITTVGAAPIDSKDVYVDGHISILSNGTSLINNFEADAKLKGRGNFTWGLPKKPYRIKLNAKASVMGMPADKDWVLLANYTDKTLIRTATVFEFSRRLGTAWTPRSDFVDLNLNGIKIGSYMLTEQVKLAKDRVNITELKATDLSGEALTGGYLVELNERLDETVNWRSPRGVAYSLKEPSEPPTEQARYIESYMNAAEAALYAANFADPVNGYAKYIDVDTFINHFLIQELFKNKDAANFSSVYLQKERNEKLKMGPPWDFDLAGGNSNSVEANQVEGWWLRAYSPWYSRLFQDPAFTAKVKARWNAVKAEKIDTLDAYIDQTAVRMGVSQQSNFNIWRIMGQEIFAEVTPLPSYASEVAYFKSWIKQRAAWMDRELNK